MSGYFISRMNLDPVGEGSIDQFKCPERSCGAARTRPCIEIITKPTRHGSRKIKVEGSHAARVQLVFAVVQTGRNSR